MILTCPICHHDTPVQVCGAGLQPAFQINHFLEIMEEHKIAVADPPASAEKAERDSASLAPLDEIKVYCCEHAVMLFLEQKGWRIPQV